MLPFIEAEHKAPIPLHRNLLPYVYSGTDTFSKSGCVASTQSHQDSHQKEVKQSTTCLQKAQDNVFKKKRYQSASTCVTLHAEFCHHNPGKVPYPWQVDIGEALHLEPGFFSYSGHGCMKKHAACHALVFRSKKNCGCYFTLKWIRGGLGRYLPSSLKNLHKQKIQGWEIWIDGLFSNCCEQQEL